VVLDLHLADRLDLELLGIDVDLTRFQRAGEGARQSPAGGRDDVVERRRVRRPKTTGSSSAGRWASRCGPPRRSIRTRDV
jgi:hypothetical protein